MAALLEHYLSHVATALRGCSAVRYDLHLSDLWRDLPDDGWRSWRLDEHAALLYLPDRLQFLANRAGGGSRCDWRCHCYSGCASYATLHCRSYTRRKRLTRWC